MRILVTGCTGFVGGALVKSLLLDGNTVYCASRSSSCKNNQSAHHLSLDLSSRFRDGMFSEGLDCIVHAAATMDRTLSCTEMFATNVVSTLQLLELGAKCGIRKFVFISSGAVYGYADHPICETDALKPDEFYGVTKHHAEMLVNSFSTSFETSILRLFYPYGEGQAKGIIPLLYNSIVTRTPLTIHLQENPQINPVHISNIVDIVVRTINSRKNHLFNIAGNEIVTIKRIADILSTILGIRYDIIQSTENKGNMVGSNQLLLQEFSINSVISLTEGLERFCHNIEK